MGIGGDDQRLEVAWWDGGMVVMIEVIEHETVKRKPTRRH